MLCVRWYLRYSLSYRDLEEIMAERGLSVDHVTIWRWVQRYAPILNQRIRRELRRPNRSWRVDETYVRVAGSWAYLYRAVDSAGETIDFMLSPKRDLTAAKLFLRLALSAGKGIGPRVINVDGHPAYARAIRELKESGELAIVSPHPSGAFRWCASVAGTNQFQSRSIEDADTAQRAGTTTISMCGFSDKRNSENCWPSWHLGRPAVRRTVIDLHHAISPRSQHQRGRFSFFRSDGRRGSFSEFRHGRLPE